MAVPKLSAELRGKSGSAGSRQLRKEGQVPAVVYGHGEPSRSIKVPIKVMDKVIEEFGSNSLVTMSLDGEVLQANIQDVQREPVTKHIIHVDFRHLIAGEKVKIRIPINVNNVDSLTKEGIMLGQSITELEVSCMPKDIIQSIDIDAATLVVHVPLTVGDLKLPDTIEALHDADETVVHAYYNKVSTEEETDEEEVVQPVFDTGAAEEV
jgi:large subunit ribosomal protein L25